MKTFLPSLIASSFLAPAAFAQKTGDAVTPDALGKLEWVQGTAPATWEPGKVYILECWATWCGPCIAAIPHVDELYDKYQEKGLRVIGVNVWEDGKDMVEGFVKKKGDGMSYPVAYTGKGGAFETEWLKPAGVKGIPHAFVVKDGKVLFTSHPSQLTGELIEDLLAGGEGETKAIESIQAAKLEQESIGKAMQAFRQASTTKDTAAMEAAVSQLKALDDKSPYLAALDLELLIAKGDWAAAEASLSNASADPMLGILVTSTANKLPKMPEAPESFRKAVATTLGAQLAKNGHAMQFQILAKLQWSMGEKEAAVQNAKRAVAWVKSPAAKGSMPAAPFEKFAAALEKGEMPTDEQMTGWIRESIPANAKPAAKVVPKDG